MARQDTSGQYRSMLKSDLGSMMQQGLAGIRQNTMGISSGLRNQQMRQTMNDAYSSMGNQMRAYSLADLARRQQAFGQAGGLEMQKLGTLAGLFGQQMGLYNERAVSAGNVAMANAANRANLQAGYAAALGNIASGGMQAASAYNQPNYNP